MEYSAGWFWRTATYSMGDPTTVREAPVVSATMLSLSMGPGAGWAISLWKPAPLYRVEWARTPTDLIRGRGASVLLPPDDSFYNSNTPETLETRVVLGTSGLLRTIEPGAVTEGMFARVAAVYADGSQGPWSQIVPLVYRWYAPPDLLQPDDRYGWAAVSAEAAGLLGVFAFALLWARAGRRRRALVVPTW